MAHRIIIIISFMQSIYNYIPATNHVSMEYSVAAGVRGGAVG
jgi:hypothetical protein